MGLKEEISRKKDFELNENENKPYQNLWDAVKTMLREKFMTLSTYIIKEVKSRINNLSFFLRKLEVEKQIKSKVSSKKEISVSTEMNEIENRKPIEKINQKLVIQKDP